MPISVDAVSGIYHINVFRVLFKKSNMSNLTLQKEDPLKVTIHISFDWSVGTNLVHTGLADMLSDYIGGCPSRCGCHLSINKKISSVRKYVLVKKKSL